MSDASSKPPVPSGEHAQPRRVTGRRLHGSAAYARGAGAYEDQVVESVRIVTGENGGNGHDPGREAPSAEPEPPDEPTGETQERSRGQRAARTVLEWLVVIGGALLVALLVKTFLVQAFWIPSPSMNDTLVRGDRVLVNKLADDIDNIDRGDIIVFKRPDNGNGPHPEDEIQDLIKRVIGLPGDELEARDGVVYVNGQRLDEPYVAGQPTTDLETLVVPEGHVFMMGDNRGNSSDSRRFGPVAEESIVGRAFLRVWPLSNFGRL